MKIVDSPRPQGTKGAHYRKMARSIAGAEKAACFDDENELKYFCKVARAIGLKPRTQKLQKGGWKVWL